MRLLFLFLALAGCRQGTAPGPLAGRAEATAAEERTVALGGRTLVLDGFAGDVRVETLAGATGVRVRFVRRARGATEASARERLAAVTIEEGSDADLYQYVWRANRPDGIAEDGLSVDVVATVPTGSAVVVRTLAGGVAVDGPLGDLDVGVGSGTVIVGRAAARRLRVDVRTGDVTVIAAAFPAGARWTVETAAGDVDLSVPDGASARIDASTDAGRVADRGLPEAARVVRSGGPAGERLDATLGRGGADVRLHTAAGTVTVGGATDIDGTETGQVDE